MSLLERVATLIRANLNDLVDQAEDPEKLLKQLLLDMQNQFMQLKTQTATAIAHQHLSEGKRAENARAQADWRHKAELALSHDDEALARTALERSLAHENTAANYLQQLAEQDRQVQTLRDSLSRLEAKMTETRAQADLLIARHRRARLAMQTGAGEWSNPGGSGLKHDNTLDRLRSKVLESEALGHGYAALNDISAHSKLETLEKNDRLDALLSELKSEREAKS